jgi:hypothetical protein
MYRGVAAGAVLNVAETTAFAPGRELPPFA